MQVLAFVLGLHLHFLLCKAQFPPVPSGLTSLDSQLNPDVKITYKQSHICETTPGVNSYSGYVHLPATALSDVGDYNISTYFWYFEARNNPHTAPLAIYLAGGPGEPSTYAALDSESGPCYVNPDGNSTTINPWSFNNHVNMLYIDQPVQTGFSYDVLVNGSYNLETGDVTPLDPAEALPTQNETLALGTFASQNPLSTTNNSIQSARALWHFAEHWFSSFPEYNTASKQVSIWGNSYGGFWAPAVAAYFDQQLKSATTPCGRAFDLEIATLGLTNGCVDFLIQAPLYPQLAYNNTYGIELFPQLYSEALINNFTMPGGCRDLIIQCRELGAQGDPDWNGANETVNEACILATDYCYAYVISDLNAVANRSDFDIAVVLPDPCPVYAPIAPFLNQGWVQAELGVRVNFTFGSNAVLEEYSLDAAFPFSGTGDAMRRGIAELEYALDHDITVAMVFGDRDYRCNWLAGERLSLSADYSRAAQFAAAGYEAIVTNGTYDGGVVRQHGHFSFSRVYEAGHSVSAYQPDTVYHIFMRAMFDRDIATGEHVVSSATNYSSVGPSSCFGIKNLLPEPPTTCMVDGQYQAQPV